MKNTQCAGQGAGSSVCRGRCCVVDMRLCRNKASKKPDEREKSRPMSCHVARLLPKPTRKPIAGDIQRDRAARTNSRAILSRKAHTGIERYTMISWSGLCACKSEHMVLVAAGRDRGPESVHLLHSHGLAQDLLSVTRLSLFALASSRVSTKESAWASATSVCTHFSVRTT